MMDIAFLYNKICHHGQIQDFKKVQFHLSLCRLFEYLAQTPQICQNLPSPPPKIGQLWSEESEDPKKTQIRAVLLGERRGKKIKLKESTLGFGSKA